MQLPQWLAEFNRYVTNPIQRLWAGYLPMMGILEHVGRTSGRTFRTPLIVFPTQEGVAIHLTYGPDRDWLKNLRAADGPRVVPKSEATQQITGVARLLFGRLPFDQSVLLRRL